MNMSIKKIMSYLCIQNMAFNRSSHMFFKKNDSTINSPKHIDLPYMDEENVLYNEFLMYMQLDEIKMKLHQEKDFGVAFREFIEENEMNEQSIIWIYHEFKDLILKQIAIDWCRHNHYRFEDDYDINRVFFTKENGFNNFDDYLKNFLYEYYDSINLFKE